MNAADNLAAWRLLLALGQTGNLTRATIEAGIELSAASRMLAALERSLGVPLVDRSKKPIGLSEAAAALVPKLEELADAHETVLDAVDQLSRGALHAIIRLSIPSNITRRSSSHLLERYREIDPHVDFEIYSNLDHTDVLGGRVDAAYLPYCPSSVPGLHVIPTFRVTNFLLASPEYLERHGTPERVEDLTGHGLLVRTDRNYPVTTRLYSLTETFDFETCRRQPLPSKLGGPGTARDLRRTGRRRSRTPLSITYGDTLSCLQSALEGLGIAVDLSLGMAGDLIDSGKLVPVLPGWHRPIWNLALVTRDRNLSNAPLIGFLNWYAAEERRNGPRRWFDMYRRWGLDPEAVLARGY